MTDFEIRLNDGTSRIVEIPQYLPYEIGKKIRLKIRSKAKDQVHEIENPIELIVDIQELLLNWILQDKGLQLKDITQETADRLYSVYDSQISGVIEKKNN